MDALLMCGGRGTRLETDREKPLVEVCGRPMVERVAAALGSSSVETAHAVVSPATPETARYVRDSLSLSVVETAGAGYVADLTDALDAVGRPVVTVAADLPLLTGAHVDAAIEASRDAAGATAGEESAPVAADEESASATAGDAASVTVCVPADLKRRLGASLDTTFEHGDERVAPTGLNVVAGETDTVQLTCDDRLAVNVNRQTDLELAEALCD